MEKNVPKYVNTGGQPREKCIIAAYALVTKFGARQEDVAKVMNCTQPTISNWVKEGKLRNEISDLRNQIAAAEGYIGELSSQLGLIEYDPEG